MVELYCRCYVCDLDFHLPLPDNLENIRCPQCSSDIIIKRRVVIWDKSFEDPNEILIKVNK